MQYICIIKATQIIQLQLKTPYNLIYIKVEIFNEKHDFPKDYFTIETNVRILFELMDIVHKLYY